MEQRRGEDSKRGEKKTEVGMEQQNRGSEGSGNADPETSHSICWWANFSLTKD